MRDVLVLDGSQGEGGGQILRTALSLSLVRGQAFRLVNIRTGRRNPGLLPQHLAALRAAATIGGAIVSGTVWVRSRSASLPRDCRGPGIMPSMWKRRSVAAAPAPSL